MKITQTYSIKLTSEELDGVLPNLIEHEPTGFTVTALEFIVHRHSVGTFFEGVNIKRRPPECRYGSKLSDE